MIGSLHVWLPKYSKINLGYCLLQACMQACSEVVEWSWQDPHAAHLDEEFASAKDEACIGVPNAGGKLAESPRIAGVGVCPKQHLSCRTAKDVRSPLLLIWPHVATRKGQASAKPDLTC